MIIQKTISSFISYLYNFCLILNLAFKSCLFCEKLHSFFFFFTSLFFLLLYILYLPKVVLICFNHNNVIPVYLHMLCSRCKAFSIDGFEICFYFAFGLIDKGHIAVDLSVCKHQPCPVTFALFKIQHSLT